MTSSLVGSEMCIRDRALLSQHSRRNAPRLECCESNAIQLIGEPDPEEAVSYTHLTLPTICSV
eukprot:10054194-Prorocentrum_lima.AAC.1